MLAFSNDYYGMIFRATQSVELFCAYEHYYTVQITTPKKAASVRKVPLLKVVADALESWREKQNADKRKLKKKWGVNNSLLKDYPELIFTTQYGNYYLSTQAERECKRITSIMNRREEKMH